VPREMFLFEEGKITKNEIRLMSIKLSKTTKVGEYNKEAAGLCGKDLEGYRLVAANYNSRL